MTVKARERFDLVLYIVGANGLVEQLDKSRVDRIELEDVVVDHHERIVYLGTVGARAIGKHGNLGVWGQLVAQRDGAGDGLRKLRCGGGLAIAGKRDYIGQLTLDCIPCSLASSASSTTPAVLYGSWQGRSALRPFSQ